MGVTTTAALSAVDVDDASFFEDYFAEVTHLGPAVARKRLRHAIERAQMICDGISITRLGDGPIDVPIADVEIDLDIESDLDGRVYCGEPASAAAGTTPAQPMSTTSSIGNRWTAMPSVTWREGSHPGSERNVKTQKRPAKR